MNLWDRLRQWWQERTGEEDTPFDGDAPAWFISMGVHLVLFILLALFWTGTQRNFDLLVLPEPDIPEPERLVEDVYFSKDPMEQIGANSVSGTQSALALAPNLDEVSDVPQEVVEQPNPTIKLSPNIDLATAPNVDENLVVRGATGEGVTGAAGAVDRLTYEILQSLEQRPTLVVWLFDQTGSLDRTRNYIADRFERIYRELGVIQESGHNAFAQYKPDQRPLLSAIVAFGKGHHFLVEEPTDDVQKLKQAARNVPHDDSGEEFVFSTILSAVNKYKVYRTRKTPRRNVLFVAVTDERGSDFQLVDKAVAQCQRYQIRVYVLGAPAPFGREQAYLKWIDPDPNYDQSVQWIPVDQGPETLFPERIKLGLPGVDRNLLDELDSGFGPYALARLCYETGGIYFSMHPNRTARVRAVGAREIQVMSSRLRFFFDPAVMRLYAPDYVTVKEYQRLLATNRARAALVMAARQSWVDPMEEPRLRFPFLSEPELKQQLDEAQKVAARLEPKINRLYQILLQGEADRDKLTRPRWQAGYDLAMGRVLAAKVRVETYNQMLALLKQGKKFKNPNSDTWVLRPADATVGSQLERLRKKAKMYLQRVVDEHPGTPWAVLAQMELDTPIGWEWTEAHTGVRQRRERAGNNNNNANPRDRLRRLQKRKPRRKIKL